MFIELFDIDMMDKTVINTDHIVRILKRAEQGTLIDLDTPVNGRYRISVKESYGDIRDKYLIRAPLPPF